MNKFEAIKSSFNIAALIFNTTDTSLHNHSSTTQNLRNSLFVRDENVLYFVLLRKTYSKQSFKVDTNQIQFFHICADEQTI